MWSLRSNATLGLIASAKIVNGVAMFGFWMIGIGVGADQVFPASLETAISTKTVVPGASARSSRTQTAASLFGLCWSMAIVGLLSLPFSPAIFIWLFATTVGVGSVAASNVRDSSD